MNKQATIKPLPGEEKVSTPIKALNYLISTGKGFYRVTANERKAIQVAFAYSGLVVHPKAFDAVLTTSKKPNFENVEWLKQHVSKITLIEIKSTKRELDKNFNRYFFALTTSELLVAQSLKSQYKVALVNTTNNSHKILTIRQLLARARAFYPTWSISL